MMRRLLFFLAVAWVACSCTSIDCPVQTAVRTYYALQKSDQTTDTLKDILYVVSRVLEGKDTLLLNQAITLTTFSLPIGYANPEDTLCFRFRNGSYAATDTVWIKKENIPHFESVDCSATFFHRLTAVRCTHHAIDSIIINSPTVDYDPQTIHFYLYLKSRH